MKYRAYITGTRVELKVDYEDNDLPKKAGMSWSSKGKVWKATASWDLIQALKDLGVGIKGKIPDVPDIEDLMVNFEDYYEEALAGFDFVGNPYDHQLLTFLVGTQVDRLPCLLDMGLGKTYVSCHLMRYRMERRDIRRALVVCTRGTAAQWKAEWERWCPGLPVHLPGGRVSSRLSQALGVKKGLCILTYEAILTAKPRKIASSKVLEDLNREIHSEDLDPDRVLAVQQEIREELKRLDEERLKEERREKKHKDLVTQLCKAYKGQMVVYDESTLLKNPTTKRSKAALKLSKAARYAVILTGSPITNKIEDLYGQFLILDHGLTFGSTISGFRARYMKDVGSVFPKWVISKRGKKKVREMLEKRSVRFTKEECLDLPERTFEIVRVEMSDAQERTYTDVQNDMFLTHITKTLRLQQITSGFTGSAKAPVKIANTKMVKLIQILQEVTEEHKVIVWAKFRHDIECVRDEIEKKLKFTPAIVMGSRDNEPDKHRFMETEGCRVIICQVNAGAHGLNLTQASYMVYYSNDWDLEARTQSLDRNRRIGQTKNQHVIDLVSVRDDGRITVDELVTGALARKQNLVNDTDPGELSRILAEH